MGSLLDEVWGVEKEKESSAPSLLDEVWGKEEKATTPAPKIAAQPAAQKQVAPEERGMFGKAWDYISGADEPAQETYPPEYYAARRKQVMEDVGGVLKSAGKSMYEVPAHVAFGTAMFPFSTAMSASELATGLIKGEGAPELKGRMERVNKAAAAPIGMEPTTQEFLGVATAPFALPRMAGGEIGEAIGGEKGRIIGEVAGDITLAAVPWMTSKIAKAVENSNWYRSLKVPEKNIVIQEMSNMDVSGKTEGQIIREAMKRGDRSIFEDALRKRSNVEEVVKREAPVVEEAVPVPGEEIMAAREGIIEPSKPSGVPAQETPIIPPTITPAIEAKGTVLPTVESPVIGEPPATPAVQETSVEPALTEPVALPEVPKEVSEEGRFDTPDKNKPMAFDETFRFNNMNEAMDYILTRRMAKDNTVFEKTVGKEGEVILRKLDLVKQPGIPIVEEKALPEPEKVVEEAVDAAQKDDVPLKVQKKYLLDNIDEAIASAPAGYNTDSRVTIEVPGDGTFNIYNSQTTLQTFRDAVAKKFPGAEAKVPSKPSMPSRRPGKRVTGEGVTYYNEFSPRNQQLITDKEKVWLDDKGEQRVDTKNIYTKDGFFSNGHYMVKVTRRDIPGKVQNPKKLDKTIKDIIPSKLQPADIVGEFNRGLSEQDPPLAHVVGKDGTEQVIDARYADVVLTRFPDAKSFSARGNPEGPIVFKSKGEYVGAVMPRKVAEPGELKSLINELRGEPEQAVTEPEVNTEPPIGTPEHAEFTAEEEATGRPNPGGTFYSTDDYAARGAFEETVSQSVSPDDLHEAAYTPQDALVNIIQMPEMLELFKEISGGKYPIIFAKMKKAGGSAALGYFNWPKKQLGLSTEAFRSPELSRMVFAHEIGHWIDFLSKYGDTMSRGNILGHLAGLSEAFRKATMPLFPGAPGEMTQADRDALKKEAARQARAGGAQNGPQVSNEDIIAIWNNLQKANPELERYIAELTQPKKVELAKAAMKGTGLPEWFNFNASGISEEASRIYQELLLREMEKRNLFKRDEIMAELKNISHKWRPISTNASPAYVKYRHSPAELYADAVSILFNRPKMMEQEAPRTWEMWHNYLQNRPTVQEAWNQLQIRLSQGEEALQNYRYNAFENVLTAGNEQFKNLLQRKTEDFTHKAWDQLMRALNTERYPWLGVAGRIGEKTKFSLPEQWFPEKWADEKDENKVTPEDAMRFLTEKLPFSDSTIHLYYLRISEAIKPLLEKGHRLLDLDKYAQLWSAMTEGKQKANPMAYTLTDAYKALEHLKKVWGPEKYGDIQEAFNKWQEIRRDTVMPEVQNSEAWTPELTALMVANQNYVRRIILDKMLNKYGESTLRTIFSGKVYERIGSFKDVAPGFTATMIQDVALLHASHVNQIKREVLSLLEKEVSDPKIIRPAEREIVNGRVTGRLRESPYKGFTLVRYAHHGKIKGAYLADNLAGYLNRDPQDFKELLAIWNAVSNPIKNILVSHNPGWNIWNIQRDFRESIMKLPGATLAKLAPMYKAGFQEAIDEVFRGKVSKDLEEMYHDKSIVAESVWQADIAGSGHYIEAIMKQMGQMVAKGGDVNTLKKYLTSPEVFKVIWDTLGKVGQVGERASKIAAHKYMKKHFPNMPAEKRAHIVRTRAGSPNPYERGSANWIYNNVFPFSNMGKEGYRSHYEAFKEDPIAYAWKFFKWNILFGMTKWLGLAGAMGLLAGWWMDWFKGIPDRDLANYTTIPVWQTDDGKTVYFLLPHDFTSQAILAVGTMMALPGMTAFRVGEFALGGLPYTNIHPIFQIAGIVYNAMKGQNTLDSWSGRNELSEDALKIGGSELAMEVAKASWNKIFSGLYRFTSKTEKELTNELEKMNNLPIVGPILRRFLRVSDQGYDDAIKRKLVLPYEQESAMEKQAVHKAINDYLNETKAYYSNLMTKPEMNYIHKYHSDKLYGQMVGEGTIKTKKPEDFWSTYKEMSINKSGSIESKAINRAPKPLQQQIGEYVQQETPERIQYLRR